MVFPGSFNLNDGRFGLVPCFGDKTGFGFRVCSYESLTRTVPMNSCHFYSRAVIGENIVNYNYGA
jgi:hypothetical protein